MTKQLKCILIILFCLSFQNTKANAKSDWLIFNEIPISLNQQFINFYQENIFKNNRTKSTYAVNDLIVQNTANKSYITPYAVDNTNIVSFSIKIQNNFDQRLDEIAFENSFLDANNAVIPTANLEIQSIILENFISNDATQFQANGNSISGNLALLNDSIGTVHITAKLKTNIDGNQVKNRAKATIVSPPLTESSTTNNTAIASVPISNHIQGKQDIFNWSGNGNYNVIQNDILDENSAGQGFIFGTNVTITPKDPWPSNITLNTSNGIITVANNPTKPTTALYYTICNNAGDCKDVAVTFLGEETIRDGIPSSLFSPGTISAPNVVCYDGTVEIVNTQKASYSVLLQTSFRYYWQASNDGGITWKALSEDDGSDNENTESEYSIEIASNGDKLTLHGLKNDIYIRRSSRRILTTVYVYTAPVKISPAPQNTIVFPDNKQSIAIEKGSTYTFPTVTTSLNSTVEIKNSAGENVTATQTFTEAGEYNFTVVATTTAANGQLEDCVTTAPFKIIVYDISSCLTRTNKVFATHQQGWTSGLSGVSTPERAVNGNRADYATLTGGVVLLGIGTVGIDLYFTNADGELYTGDDLKGKKVTLKLGEQYSGLKVAGGLSVIGRNIEELSDITGIAPPVANAGTTFGVQGSVLEALKGDNVFEFSFTPANSSGTPVAYNGVRVQLGSLIGVADLATIFHAYIEEEVTVDPNNTSHCYDPENPAQQIIVSPPGSLEYPSSQDGLAIGDDDYINIENENIVLNEFIDDATWGNRTEVIEVATGLNSVIYPYYAIDNNYDSYALFNATVGVLNQQFLRAHLRQTAMPGDQIQITLAYPNINAVNLSLLQLGNFKIVYFLNGAEVGEELMEEFRILDIGIFNFKDKRRTVISKPVTIPFNSVEIRQFNSVNVNLGQSLRIHDVRVNPMMMFEGQENPTDVSTLCAADFLTLQSNDFCATYEVSFAKIISFGDVYTDKDGNPILDDDGNPIKMIEEIEDIPGSELTFSHFDDNKAYFDIQQLYQDEENEGLLLVKVQTYKQGCAYGSPQYLRVKLINCNAAIVNPVIKTGP